MGTESNSSNTNTWTRRDKLHGVWDKSKGHLEILLAGALGVGLYSVYNSNESNTFIKGVCLVGGSVCISNIAMQGVRTIGYYRNLYRDIHNQLSYSGQENSE